MKVRNLDVIKLQEELGLDVLVHGEPERNDMVEYFAEQLGRLFRHRDGVVQSYGTAACGRSSTTCTRPSNR